MSIQSFFIHYRPYRQTLARLCSFFSYCEDEMDAIVRKFIENPVPVHVCLASGKACFPKRLLVDAETWQGEISLDGQRPEDFVQEGIDFCTPQAIYWSYHIDIDSEKYEVTKTYFSKYIFESSL